MDTLEAVATVEEAAEAVGKVVAAAVGKVVVRVVVKKHRLATGCVICVTVSDFFIALMHSLYRVALFHHTTFPLNHSISPAIRSQSQPYEIAS